MSDRISRLLVPGEDNPFEYETRKRGVGIVPEVKAKKSKLEGKETKKVGLGIETKFGDISTSATKSKDMFGDKTQKSIDYKYARRFGKDKKSKAELFARRAKGDVYGEKQDDYSFGGKLRFEFNQGGLTPKQAKHLDFDGDGTIRADDLKAKREGKFSRGGRAAIRGFKFGGIF
tara:strand:- start:447 stop:968 length:522 start_codon:yes stop_codon:yes gene_type:complete